MSLMKLTRDQGSGTSTPQEAPKSTGLTSRIPTIKTKIRSTPAQKNTNPNIPIQRSTLAQKKPGIMTQSNISPGKSQDTSMGTMGTRNPTYKDPGGKNT